LLRFPASARRNVDARFVPRFIACITGERSTGNEHAVDSTAEPQEVQKMGIVVALLLLALLFGGVGLFATGLKWLLIVSLVLFIASAFTGYRSHSHL
jgi:hypothetical protein